MRSFATLCILSLLALAAPSVAADENGRAHVTLEVALGAGALVPYKTCEVVVPEGAPAAAALDAAVANGCLSSWSYTEYNFDRFVDCIDGVCGQTAAIFVGTFWEIQHNGASASVGVLGLSLADGDTLGFDYRDYAFLPL